MCEGHTTGQFLPLVGKADRRALYTADMVPTAAHVRMPWIMGYDLRPIDMLDEKRRLSTMRLVGAVDHDALFPRCAAVLHHGGAGSTHTGLRAGRATLVCSVLGDQPFWGRVVARHGAGTWTPFRTLTTSTLRRSLEHVMREDVQARAHALGQRMRAERPGVEVAADLIEAMGTRR